MMKWVTETLQSASMVVGGLLSGALIHADLLGGYALIAAALAAGAGLLALLGST